MITILLAALLVAGARCDRPLAEPRGYHARGFGRVAEIFPPRSRLNPGERPSLHLYEVGHPGTRWDVDARHVTTATLPHATFPAEAVVSPAGHVVTLDEYDLHGQTNVVVIVDDAGTVLGRYDLPDLLAAEEIATLDRSDCGIHWREGAEYFFLLEPSPRFYVALDGGPVLEFDLGDGMFRRGVPAAFPELARIREKPFANERVEPWSTSLRFSSITDVIRARSSPRPSAHR